VSAACCKRTELFASRIGKKSEKSNLYAIYIVRLVVHTSYGVAAISRLLKIMGVSCKRAL